MPEYIVYFNQQWVPDYPVEHFTGIAETSRAVVAEMREAGVLVHATGLEEEVAFAHADYVGDSTAGESVVTDGPYAETKEWIGGFTLIDVPDDEAARYWTGRIAVGCRWPQEVRRVKPGGMRGS